MEVQEECDLFKWAESLQPYALFNYCLHLQLPGSSPGHFRSDGLIFIPFRGSAGIPEMCPGLNADGLKSNRVAAERAKNCGDLMRADRDLCRNHDSFDTASQCCPPFHSVSPTFPLAYLSCCPQRSGDPRSSAEAPQTRPCRDICGVSESHCLPGARQDSHARSWKQILRPRWIMQTTF